ncbi:MAG: BON domain-containing protein [Candidatus Promineifilaceae bacterium]|nr:BON domain-containing protein [Candidatus Promineifilaceae bacterium]
MTDRYDDYDWEQSNRPRTDRRHRRVYRGSESDRMRRYTPRTPDAISIGPPSGYGSDYWTSDFAGAAAVGEDAFEEGYRGVDRRTKHTVQGRYGDADVEGYEETMAEPTGWRVRGPHTGKGPAGYRRSSERIEEDVCERLTHDGWVDATNVEVEVEEDVVNLRGTVDSRRSKRRAEDLAESVRGVFDVMNYLTIEREG